MMQKEKAPPIRTTVTLDADLLATAQRFSGLAAPSAVVREALTRFVQSEAARRLAAMGGTDPDAWAAPRRRFGRGR
jgi:Arc/MetJ family transcription regulator